MSALVHLKCAVFSTLEKAFGHFYSGDKQHQHQG